MEAGYSVESLENGIKGCKKNIQTFEDAIEKERETIKDYRYMIEEIEVQKRQAKIREEMSSRIDVVRDKDINLN